MPVLHLLPSGLLTLTFGRPDNWIAVSPDGSGRAFEQAQLTYQNHPDTDTGAFQRTLDGRRAQFMGGHIGERAVEGTDGRARGTRHDDGG